MFLIRFRFRTANYCFVQLCSFVLLFFQVNREEECWWRFLDGKSLPVSDIYKCDLMNCVKFFVRMCTLNYFVFAMGLKFSQKAFVSKSQRTKSEI